MGDSLSSHRIEQIVKAILCVTINITFIQTEGEFVDILLAMLLLQLW